MIDAWSARTAIARALGDFSWRHYLATLRASAAIPIQRVGSALYLLLPATLAASFFGLHVAGWFVLADRTVRAVNGLFQPVTSTLFPLQLDARGQSRDSPARRRLRLYLALAVGASLIASTATFVLADFIVVLLGGEAFAPAAEFLRWLSPLTALVTMNMILSNTLYTHDAEAVIARAVWACGLAFTATIVFFADRSQGTFAACCMLVEAALMIWLAVAVLRRRSPDAAPAERTHSR